MLNYKVFCRHAISYKKKIIINLYLVEWLSLRNYEISSDAFPDHLQEKGPGNYNIMELD